MEKGKGYDDTTGCAVVVSVSVSCYKTLWTLIIFILFSFIFLILY